MKLRRLLAPLLIVFAVSSSYGALSRWQKFSLNWYLNRGRQDMKIGSFRPAIEAYQKALTIDPENREALRNLGVAYERQGLIDSAVATFDRYLAQYPDDSAIAFRQAEILSWTRYTYRKADSLRYYELAMKNSPNPTAEANAAKTLPTLSANQAKISELELAMSHDPNNREVMRSLARAYEDEGDYEKAVALYDKYLAKYPDDADVAFHQAQILSWERFANRKPDALKYYQLGLETKAEPTARVEYAQLLASDKQTNPAAIDQYQQVLQSDPRNVKALRGLAMAYSWTGDSDRAITFAELAVAADPNDAESVQLRDRLRVGREPTVRAHVDYFNQHGGRFGLRGWSTSLDAHADVKPSLTLIGDAGYADYRHESEREDDVFIRGGFQRRLRSVEQFEVILGHHSIGPDARSFVFDADYSHQGRKWLTKLGVKRDVRTDSLAAIAGRTVGGVSVGAARSNILYGELAHSLFGGKIWVSPYGGWVSAQSVSDNKFLGAHLRWDSWPLLTKGSLELAAAFKAEGSHYQKDASNDLPSAVEPYGGGYFSPNVFVNQTPMMVAHWTPRSNQRVDFEGGPSAQYVEDTAVNGRFRLGGEANVAYQYQFAPRLSLRLSSGIIRVSDVYTLFSAGAALIGRF